MFGIVAWGLRTGFVRSLWEAPFWVEGGRHHQIPRSRYRDPLAVEDLELPR